MSLFGAMSTAISGLSAQAGAFANIGDNVANSQTVGFKRIETSFEDYLTVSTPEVNQSGTVTARPSYVNDVQGSFTQTDNPLDLAIAGQGFFSVSRQVGDANGAPVFGLAPEYTRAGDFSMNRDGYLVNSSGSFLNGWLANATGTPDQTKLVPVQVSKTASSPVATTSVAMVGNIAQSADGAPVSTPIQVYDSLGQAHSLQLNWAPSAGTPSSWTVAIVQPGTATPLGTATVGFGPAAAAGAADGTVGSITGTGGTATGNSFVAGSTATLGFTADLGAGMQTVAIGLGTFGKTDGLTQYPGTAGSLRVVKQDGAPAGAFSGVATKSNGDVVVNYDNGQSRIVARVPLATFANPNALQREDGQAFSATRESGAPAMAHSGSNGSSLVASATENSNVDIAKEFTKLIVAQRAYSANTKLVTTADELLQQTIDLKR